MRINQLGRWIQENIPGEPSKSYGVVECACEIMGKQKAKLVDLMNEISCLSATVDRLRARENNDGFSLSPPTNYIRPPKPKPQPLADCGLPGPTSIPKMPKVKSPKKESPGGWNYYVVDDIPGGIETAAMIATKKGWDVVEFKQINEPGQIKQTRVIWRELKK